VTYSYNKTNDKHEFLKFIFWNRTLHVSGSISVHHQESSTVHTAISIGHIGYADCLLACLLGFIIRSCFVR
jgi:predicted acetyltransferase